MTQKTAREFVERMRRDGEFRCGVEGAGDEKNLAEILHGEGFCFGQRELMGAMAACMREMEGTGGGCCAHAAAAAPAEGVQGAAAAPKLEDLVPIAVVAAAGCVPCTEKMVARALGRGSRPRDVRKTLALVEDLGRHGCLAEAVGEEVVTRMREPVAAGRRALGSQGGGAPAGEGRQR